MSEELANEDQAAQNRADNAASSPAVSAENNAAEGATAETTEASAETRRGFFELGSYICGAIVSVGPVAIGLAAFLDPLGRQKPDPIKYREEGGDETNLIRVAALSAIGATPQRFQVIADKRDSWNFMPDQPIGSVYIQRVPGSDEASDTPQIRVFNTTCPHAGCSVSCDGDAYVCPCHNSAFNLDGSKKVSASGRPNPSPRPLDDLPYEIRDGEVWVEYKNFYTGKHEQEEKK